MKATASIFLFSCLSLAQAQVDLPEAMQDLASQAEERVGLQGSAIMLRSEHVTVGGQSLAVPFVQEMEQAFAAAATARGASLQARLSGARWMASLNLGTPGMLGQSALRLTLSTTSLPSESYVFEAPLNLANYRGALDPTLENAVAYLITALEQQNTGITVPVNLREAVPSEGEAPRRLGASLNSALQSRMATAQALRVVHPSAQVEHAHALTISYLFDGRTAIIRASVAAPGELPWASAEARLPVSRIPVDLRLAYSPRPLTVVWDNGNEERLGRALNAELKARLQQGNLILHHTPARSDEQAEGATQDLPVLRLHYKLQAPKGAEDRALVHAQATLEGELEWSATENKSWSAVTPLVLRPSQLEGPIPADYASVLANEAAEALFKLIGTLPDTPS